MDNGPEPSQPDYAEPDAKARRRWAKRVQRLHVMRHVALAPPFGMAVATGVLAVVGLVLAVVQSKFGPLSAIPHVLVAVAGFGLLGWTASPRIERALTDEAGEPAPWKCPALMEAACGLPLIRERHAFETRLADCLRSVTPEWWSEHAAEMRNPVTQMLVTYETPGWLRPVDGPVLPALFEAIARCGRTELLRRVEGFERSVVAPAYPDVTRAAVHRCGEALRAKAVRDREAATLLRPAEAPMDMLLRPSEPRTPQGTELLVRPVTDRTEDPASASVAADAAEAEAARDARQMRLGA